MRSFRTLLVIFSGLGLILLPSLSSGQGHSPSRKLFSVSWKDPADLREMKRLGVRARYFGKGYALVSLTETEERTLELRGIRSHLISSQGEDELFLVRVTSQSELDELERIEKPVFFDGEEMAVVRSRDGLRLDLARRGFYAVALPQEIPFAIEGRKAPRSVFSRGSLPILSEEKRESVTHVLDNVSTDSIRNVIHALTYDDVNQRYRTRWTFRRECFNEAGNFLLARLRSYLGPADSVGFEMFEEWAPDSCYPSTGTVRDSIYNIIGLKRGSQSNAGKFIVCAHYDSRGPADPAKWCWFAEPAPGADDNASGTSCVLEAARVLSPLPFDFDIEFVLFSGEELGLWGSKYYVGEALSRGENILGVFNMDMVAYNPRTDSMNVITDFNSQWLADLAYVTDSVFSGSIGLELDKVLLPTLNSDHYSFWSKGFDAVHFIENYVVTPHNPYYHTLDDTEDKLNFSMASKMTKLIVATIAQFSGTPPSATPDLSVSAGELVLMQGRGSQPTSKVVVGSEVTLLLTAHNLGDKIAASDSIKFSFYGGDPQRGGTLIADTTVSFSYLSRGGAVSGRVSWMPAESDAGARTIFGSVELMGMSETTVTNNMTSSDVIVQGETLRFLQCYVYPNPSSVAASNTLFAYELSKPGTVEIEVFDLSGRDVGNFEKVYTGLYQENGARAGMNTVRLSEFQSLPANLASGLYIYKISVFEPSSTSPSSVRKGKFAIMK
ncbi:MAG: M28 family peptidase [Candidatus Eisenbacteria bacterium]|nr:M28 family peptidase [Candidatus Eisenbacteria bacterium]